MNNNGSSQNGIDSEKLYKTVLFDTFGNPGRISGNVSQVSNVSLVSFWSSVVFLKRVKVRTGRSASVGVVTEFVNMEPSQGIGIVSLNFPRNCGWV